jgi:ATP-binding cassette, sub-family E, member 1
MEKRIAIVDPQKCHPLKCAKECIKFDPINRSGGEGFHIGPSGKATIAQEVTTEAHLICAKKCPYGAIKIVRLPLEASGKPIHQFGENGFRLYGLPIPQFGQVVGLLGRNGIGKSTAVQVLSGIIKPNFGDLTKDKDTNYDAIAALIEKYKGTIAQNYFEKMRDGKITVAYKPQNINAIPKAFKGKVGELLQKISNDANNTTTQHDLQNQQKSESKYNAILKNLDIAHLLNNDIATVSGGELQRIAIAATMLKKASVYIFDEPSSFLDIKQRLRIAKYLRELASADTAVLVIEHDLILLDYMTDYVHLIYGEQAAYGIVSKVKTSRVGLNIYLDGYIRDENIQFRPHKIKFHGRVERDESEQRVLTEWGVLTKKQGDFNLTVDGGLVRRHDVIGILGENGIGKTTFAKIITGELKPDSGNLDAQIAISYKPQQIDTESTETVREYLHDAIVHYENTLIRPLNLETLFDQELNSLSGGQLQIVTIVKCLSKPAQIYMMDEPSAYLDTEQRLAVSKLIRDIMFESGKTALIIDHDLLFIDYFSDKILVFDGEPAKRGHASGPYGIQEGMNKFLRDIGLTFRRDEDSFRPRANKVGSQMDEKQKADDELYII